MKIISSRSLRSLAKESDIPMHTTREDLNIIDMSCRFYRTAVIPYHSFLIFAIEHGNGDKNDYSAALYQFDGSAPTTFEDHAYFDLEAPATLVALSVESYSDLGDAVKDALETAELLYADQLMKQN